MKGMGVELNEVDHIFIIILEGTSAVVFKLTSFEPAENFPKI